MCDHHLRLRHETRNVKKKRKKATKSTWDKFTKLSETKSDREAAKTALHLVGERKKRERENVSPFHEDIMEIKLTTRWDNLPWHAWAHRAAANIPGISSLKFRKTSPGESQHARTSAPKKKKKNTPSVRWWMFYSYPPQE